MTDVSLAELERDPHPILARLRAHEPVAWIDALGGWLVTRRDLALAAMRDPDTFTVDDPRFTTGRVVGRSMLTTEHEEHERHRKPFAQAFRRNAMHADLAPFVVDKADELIHALEPAGRGDLRAQLAAPLAAATVTHALGMPDDRALDWYAAIVHATTELTRGAAAVTEEARQAVEELREHVGPGSDPADVATLLFGGIETTEGMIANALLHLLDHDERPQDLANAIEESLRLEPAAATIDRYATKDTTLGEARIEQGGLVTISVAAANRDPATFENPDEYVPTRPNARQHLAFAAGPHVCIGMHLARLEAHTAITRLLQRLPDIALEPHTPSPRGLVFRKPEAVNAVWSRASLPPG